MSYETLDSGKRKNFSSGMTRDTDDCKPRFDLILPNNVPLSEQLLTRWADLMERGSKKYQERNWELANSVEELNRFKASAYRHFFQAMSGDTSEDHFAAVCFNLNACVYLMYKLKVDINGNSTKN